MKPTREASLYPFAIFSKTKYSGGAARRRLPAIYIRRFPLLFPRNARYDDHNHRNITYCFRFHFGTVKFYIIAVETFKTFKTNCFCSVYKTNRQPRLEIIIIVFLDFSAPTHCTQDINLILQYCLS